MALISTVIPTYNRTHDLGRAIRSVREQTFSDWECIVVGDGTEAATVEMMAEVTAQDARFRFWNLPHTVYPDDARLRWKVAGTAAYNFGIEQARGTWVSYLADDDEYYPDHHRLLLEEAARSPKATVVYGKSRSGVNLYGNFPPDRFATCQGAVIWRRDLGLRAQTTPGDFAWDALWWDEVIARRCVCAFVHELVHLYHPAPANLTFHGS